MVLLPLEANFLFFTFLCILIKLFFSLVAPWPGGCPSLRTCWAYPRASLVVIVSLVARLLKDLMLRTFPQGQENNVPILGLGSPSKWLYHPPFPWSVSCWRFSKILSPSSVENKVHDGPKTCPRDPRQGMLVMDERKLLP